jgi:hypothetical protein
MRAIETTPAASLNAGEKVALVGCAQLRVSRVAHELKSVGGDRPLIGPSPLGTNEGIGSLSKRLLRLPTPFSVLISS